MFGRHKNKSHMSWKWHGLPSGASVKNLPANAGEIRDAGLIPGLGRSPREGHSSPLHSCLENPMNRGAWQVTVHRVAKSRHDWSNLACISWISKQYVKIRSLVSQCSPFPFLLLLKLHSLYVWKDGLANNFCSFLKGISLCLGLQRNHQR